MKKTLKASFTVEAAILVPMFLALLVLSTSVAVDLYDEVKIEAETPYPGKDVDAVTIFRLTEAGEELLFGD